MNWANFKTRFAYQLYFQYTLPDNHELMLETLCKDYFETPLHYKQSNLRFLESSLNKFVKKQKKFVDDIQNIHDFGDQLLRMDRKDVEKQLPFFLK